MQFGFLITEPCIPFLSSQSELSCYLLTSCDSCPTLNLLFLFPEIPQIFWNYSLCFKVPIIPEIIPA